MYSHGMLNYHMQRSSISSKSLHEPVQENKAVRITDFHYLDLVHGTEAVQMCAGNSSSGYTVLSPDPRKRGKACKACNVSCHNEPAGDYQFLLVYLPSLEKKDVRLSGDLKEMCYNCSD